MGEVDFLAVICVLLGWKWTAPQGGSGVAPADANLNEREQAVHSNRTAEDSAADSGAPCTGSSNEMERDRHSCSHQAKLVRLRRDLHDQIGSSLAGTTMQMESIGKTIHSDPDEACRLLSEVHQQILVLVTQVRGILADREVTGTLVSDVAVAVTKMISGIARVTGDRVAISLEMAPEVKGIDRRVGSTGFWIVREAVTNVLKHSKARQCWVSLRVSDGALRIRVEDDGIGVESGQFSQGTGLASMRGRAREHGGRCELSQRHPNGVLVRAVLPLPGTNDERSEPSHQGQWVR